MKTKHFTIGKYALQVATPRRRRWASSYIEHRFLLLGPRPGDGSCRPLAASGDIVDGRCVVDYGAMSTDQVEAVEALQL